MNGSAGHLEQITSEEDGVHHSISTCAPRGGELKEDQPRQEKLQNIKASGGLKKVKRKKRKKPGRKWRNSMVARLRRGYEKKKTTTRCSQRRRGGEKLRRYKAFTKTKKGKKRGLSPPQRGTDAGKT